MKVVEEAVFEFLGDDQVSMSVSATGGGDTHRAYRVSTPLGDLFVKVNTLAKASVLKSEYRSLKYLQQTDAAPLYPKAQQYVQKGEYCLLIMQALELLPFTEQNAEQAATALFQHHQCFADHFGWHEDNFIGASPQANSWYSAWSQFYLECRLHPQFRMMQYSGASAELLRNVESVFSEVELVLQDREIKPCLLHGDMWLGNIGWNSSSESLALYDPAPYYGDPAADIAMSHLFGSLPDRFYQSYYRLSEVSGNKRSMLEVTYNLYHAMNHFNLFGNSYEAMILSFCQNLRHATP